MAFGLDPGKLGFKLGDVLVGLQEGTTDVPEAVKTREGRLHTLSYAWDSSTLSWVVATSRGAGQGMEVFVTNAAGGTDYNTLLDKASPTVTYVGKAFPGTSTAAALWKIFKLDATSGLSLKHADGNANFDNVWDNRASLSYS